MDIIVWLIVLVVACSLIVRALFPKTITWLETAALAGMLSAIVSTGYLLTFWSATSDTEILNGQVKGKEQNRVSCSHSYKCRCKEVCSKSKDSNGRETRSCREVCDTCYEHSNDWDWDVYSSVGTFTISRVDRQGVEEPARWTAVKIGEPAAVTHGYTNFLKATPNSLFNMKLAEQEAQAKASLVPSYPVIYDYYRVKRVVSVNTGFSKETEHLDRLVSEYLRSAGAVKQVNLVLVFVKGQGREYKEFLERAWLGGKKNDVVIIFGVSELQIEWVESFTFAKSSGNAMLNVALRDNLQNLGTIADPPLVMSVISKAVNTHFRRTPMAKFQYLEDDIEPSTTAVVVIMLLLFLCLGAATYFFHRNDTFNEERRGRYRRY